MKNKSDVIGEIMKAENIKLWGSCNFTEIGNKLIECRAKQRIPKNPKSVICMLFPYKVDIKEHNVSRYAVVRDYHKVILPKLNRICTRLRDTFADYNFQGFTDNSPFREVELAVSCSLGVRGDNGLLINSVYGSYVFIGEIVTDMPIDNKKQGISNEVCLRCKKCIGACPTGALVDTEFIKERCISNISQKKGELSLEEEALLKNHNLVWGCDICQEVCPLNKLAKYTYMEEFSSEIHPVIKIGDYHRLEDRAFHWRKANVIERNIRLKSDEK